MGISGIDTRQITQVLREKGSINAVIEYKKNGKFNLKKIAKKLKNWEGIKDCDLTRGVTRNKNCLWNETVWSKFKGYGYNSKKKHHIVAIDYGAKNNILRNLSSLGCKITVVPATVKANDIFKLKPDGVFLSNGPGDPAAVTYGIEMVKELLGKKPIFGICLGHQILSLALGASTFKLKFGHRGINHPVKNMVSNNVEITSQNHGFAVDINSLPENVISTHINLNDNTSEGVQCEDLKAFSVQYHPESSPGPHDSRYLFNKFIDLIEGNVLA